MSRQVQVPSVGMSSLGVFIVAFVLLMVIGHSVLGALIFALAVTVAVAVFFLVAGDRAEGKARRETAATAPQGAGSAAAPLTSSTPPVPEPAPPPNAPEPAPEPRAETPEPRAETKAEPVSPPPPPAAGDTPPTPAGEPDSAEATGTQSEPPRLDAPREGAADDLKRIKGIGPRLEETLNGMGFFHLDQIAAWGPAEVAWMDEHLEDFRGRVSRDDWVGQARHLADGDGPEGSRRVGGGDAHAD